MNQLQMLKMALIAYVNSMKAVWSALAYPLSIISKRSGKLKDYRIYGNTVGGQSVGELVTDGEHSGKYRIGAIARGKNLFGYIKAVVQQGAIIEELPAGAITEGKISTSSSANAWARGWFCPGWYYQTAFYPVFHTGDIVTVSADITLLELREGSSYKPNIYLYSKNTESGPAPVLNKNVEVGVTKRLSQTFTIAEKYDGHEFYPVITLNSNVVKIENIQIEYGDTATNYEDYKSPQTFDIYIDAPLGKSGEIADYIDYGKGEVIRETSAEAITLPQLPQFEGTTVYEVDTTVKANGIQVCYFE